MTEDESRQNSLLTTSQRAYLRGEKDLNGDAHRQYNSRVRKRVASGIEDLLVLREDLSDEEMEKIAREVDAADVFKAAAFLDVLGEKAKSRNATAYEELEDIEHRLADLEGEVDVLTNAFDSVLRQAEDPS